MRRAARYPLAALLGVTVIVGLAASSPTSALAFDAPVIDDLGHVAEDLHPRKLVLPHISVPDSVQSEFGTSDTTVIDALNSDESNTASEETRAASQASGGDQQDSNE